MSDKPVKDQVVRHMIFSAAHPEVNFTFQRSTGRWEATYPGGENGTQTVCRLELRELLDNLRNALGESLPLGGKGRHRHQPRLLACHGSPDHIITPMTKKVSRCLRAPQRISTI
jgi:hypothetical protein